MLQRAKTISSSMWHALGLDPALPIPILMLGVFHWSIVLSLLTSGDLITFPVSLTFVPLWISVSIHYELKRVYLDARLRNSNMMGL